MCKCHCPTVPCGCQRIPAAASLLSLVTVPGWRPGEPSPGNARLAFRGATWCDAMSCGSSAPLESNRTHSFPVRLLPFVRVQICRRLSVPHVQALLPGKPCFWRPHFRDRPSYCARNFPGEAQRRIAPSWAASFIHVLSTAVARTATAKVLVARVNVAKVTVAVVAGRFTVAFFHCNFPCSSFPFTSLFSTGAGC